MKLTLRDLSLLYRRYVPVASRHPRAWPSDGALWWPAHELGHLLTVPPEWIGLPMFGLDDNGELDSPKTHELCCRELAAMSVSRRLLIACGRRDIARREGEETDYETMMHLDDPSARRRVRAILRKHNCVRLPRTREGLEAKLAAVRGMIASVVRA